MTSFEEELTDLLDARAERIDVRQNPQAEAADGPVLLETVLLETVGVPSITERGAARHSREGRTWLLGAAAGLVLVLGVFGLTRGSGNAVTELDTAGLPGEADVFFAELANGPAEFVVWLEPGVSEAALDRVLAAITESDVVGSARYITWGETFAEFQEFWADSPEILLAVEPEQLPTSFRIVVSAGADEDLVADLIRQVSDLDGVRNVAFDVDFVDLGEAELNVPATPLFVLPADELLRSPMDGTRAGTDVPVIEALVVGRRTDTGFTDMVTIERATKRGFLATTPIEIGGRMVEPFIDQDGLVAEQLDDGTWLRFTSWRDPGFLDDVVPSTIVVDGSIVFASGDAADTADVDTAGFEVLTRSRPGPHAGITTAVLGDAGPQMILSTAAVDPEAAPLFFIARNDGDAERFSNADIDGYFLRPSSSTSLGGLNGFTWRISQDHVASIVMPGSDEDVLAAIEGLLIVDEARWQAAVDGELTVETETASAPLFLLPPDDVSLEGLQGVVSSIDAWTEGPTSPGIAVGRETATGFDRLMSVALLDAREFGDSESRMIGAREVFIAAEEQGGSAAALTEDGLWLHFYVNDIDSELEPLVEAISVVDGEIVFESYGEIVELSRVSRLSAVGPTMSVAPNINSNAERAFVTRPHFEDIGLISFAVSFEAVTTVEVRGHAGFQVVIDDASSPGTAVTWFEPSGHMVYVAEPESGSALELAESLIVVDEDTWRAVMAELQLN